MISSGQLTESQAVKKGYFRKVYEKKHNKLCSHKGYYARGLCKECYLKLRQEIIAGTITEKQAIKKKRLLPSTRN